MSAPGVLVLGQSARRVVNGQRVVNAQHLVVEHQVDASRRDPGPELRISANVTGDFGERDRFERSMLSCVGWIVGSGCLKVVDGLRG
jgi:hypothetical protein